MFPTHLRSRQAYELEQLGDCRSAAVHFVVDLRVADSHCGGGTVVREDANTMLVPSVPVVALLVICGPAAIQDCHAAVPCHFMSKRSICQSTEWSTE